jgi:hypothetical protein
MVIAWGISYPFPGKAGDLQNKYYWWVEGRHSGTWNVDTNGIRFDSVENKFTSSIECAVFSVRPNENDQWVNYGLPVYAISNGEIFLCWRNAPENVGGT